MKDHLPPPDRARRWPVTSAELRHATRAFRSTVPRETYVRPFQAVRRDGLSDLRKAAAARRTRTTEMTHGSEAKCRESA
jgi:hypothetical protein